MAVTAVRRLDAPDPAVIEAAFAAIGWSKPAAQYERYLQEQRGGTATSSSRGWGTRSRDTSR